MSPLTKPSKWRFSTTTTCWRPEPRFSRVKRKRPLLTCGPTRLCLPMGSTCPSSLSYFLERTCLHDSTEADLGLSYLLERGIDRPGDARKRRRQHRRTCAILREPPSLSLVDPHRLILTVHAVMVAIWCAVGRWLGKRLLILALGGSLRPLGSASGLHRSGNLRPAFVTPGFEQAAGRIALPCPI